MVDKSVQMLPQHSKEFTEQKYWSEFFTESAKRSHEPSFEWYASFKDLKPYLQKYIPEASKVIVPGCGDSLLSEHVGIMGHHVISFDFEPGVIQKMKERPGSKVDYQVGDMLKMDFEKAAFEVVLDKGSFDALCVDNELETQKNVSAYCDGIKKVMKLDVNVARPNGFLLVSLLQDFVLEQLLANFSKAIDKYSIIIMIIHQPAMTGSSHFQRYFIYIKPAEAMSFHVQESHDGKSRSFATVDEVKSYINMDQVQNQIGPLQVEFKEFRKGQKFAVQTDDMINGKPRYTLNVIDSNREENLNKRNMGCFVVPLGCERELQIDEFEAQMDISDQCAMSRIVIVVLSQGHKYTDLQQIQDELSPKVMDLCPKSCVNKDKIPYLTTRSNLHVRELLYEDLQLTVEDQIDSERKGIDSEPLVTRQLRFYGHQTICQSEIPIIYRNTKTSKTVITDSMKTESELCPPKKQKTVIFDRSTLTFEVHQALLAAFSLTDLTQKKLKVLMLGTGAGVLPMFLKHQIPEEHLEKIDCVDNDKKIVEMAQKSFGFIPDATIESQVCDAQDFVKSTQNKYDVVLVDIAAANSENVQPPANFLKADFIRSLLNTMSDNGVCAINTLIQSEELRNSVMQEIKNVKEASAQYITKCGESSNQVIFLTKGAQASASDRTQLLQKNVQALGLQGGVWTSKKGLKILPHAEMMQPL